MLLGDRRVLFLNTLFQICNITKIFNKQGNNKHQTKYNLSQKYNKCPTIYNKTLTKKKKELTHIVYPNITRLIIAWVARDSICYFTN